MGTLDEQNVAVVSVVWPTKHLGCLACSALAHARQVLLLTSRPRAFNLSSATHKRDPESTSFSPAIGPRECITAHFWICDQDLHELVCALLPTEQILCIVWCSHNNDVSIRFLLPFI